MRAHTLTLSPSHMPSPGTVSPSVSVLQIARGQRGLSSPAPPAHLHSGLPHRPRPSAHCSTDTALAQGAHHVFISPSISAALKSSLFSFSPQPSPPVVSMTALPGVPPLLLRWPLFCHLVTCRCYTPGSLWLSRLSHAILATGCGHSLDKSSLCSRSGPSPYFRLTCATAAGHTLTRPRANSPSTCARLSASLASAPGCLSG